MPTDEGPWDGFNIRALRKTLQSHLSLSDLQPANSVPPGYHQVSFNSLPYEHELGHDGAEKRHAPSDEWKYRVWAGGYMEFQIPNIWTARPKFVAVKERITDTRLVGDLAGGNAKVFVTLTRTLFPAMVDARGKPVRRRLGGLRATNRRDNIVLKEEKYLCFMREIPESLKSTATPRRLTPPSNPVYSQSMTPSPTLLFRFSALSRNAHAIHLDAEYTRQVYGLPKLIVHGPLTSVLMLDILGEALALHTVGKPYTFAVRTFQYKNLLPLFVNEQITIACKKLHDIQPQGTKFRTAFGVTWEKWEVWIQKGVGQDATTAVRGSAWVSPVAHPSSEASSEAAEPALSSTEFQTQNLNEEGEEQAANTASE
ncbi:MaoC like domain-containing protein [Cladophialophora immunda]|nr:MaoC like domain-containing protein [Cladophialophora immunda]